MPLPAGESFPSQGTLAHDTDYHLVDEAQVDHSHTRRKRTVYHGKRRQFLAKGGLLVGLCLFILIGLLVLSSALSCPSLSPPLSESSNESSGFGRDYHKARGRDFHPLGGKKATEPEIVTHPRGPDPVIPELTEEDEQYMGKDGSYRITVIHTNDIHSHFDSFDPSGIDCEYGRDCVGGVAHHMAIINELRERKCKEGRRVFLMDAGDQFQGTLYYHIHKGAVSAAYMNFAKYDVATLGNHEFDDGPVNLYETYLSRLNFPVVCSNLKVTNYTDLEKAVTSSTVLRGQIAVIGATTPDTLFRLDPFNRVALQDVTSAVQVEIDRLRRMGLNKIVLLSHIGYGEDQKVAQNTRGLDMIVGGHTHTLLSNDTSRQDAGGPYPTTVYDLDGRPVRIVQAKMWGWFLGSFDMTFDKYGEVIDFQATGQPTLIKASLPKSQGAEKLLAPFRAQFDELKGEILGHTSHTWIHTDCRNAECPLGDLIADSMRAAIGRNDIAIMNGGGIRSGFEPPNITRAEIMNMLPFGNDLVKVPLSGKELYDTLRGFAQRRNVASGEDIITFPQISKNLRFTINRLTKSLESAHVFRYGRWEEIDQEHGEYDLVTVDFIAEGGDNFLPVVWERPVGILKLEEAFIEHIRERDRVEPAVDGRIVVRH